MRKISALLITMVIIISNALVPVATNEAYAATNEAEQIIQAIGVMNTDQQGDNTLGTDRVSRSQFTQMLVNLSPLKEQISSECNISLFSDVPKNHWAAGYIQTAIVQGWMYGYLNGSFKPEKGIKLYEAVNGIIKLLGYTNSDFPGNLITGQMTLYVSKGLNNNINKARDSYLTVDDIINLLFNTLNATTKEGNVYAETLGYVLDSEGEIDFLSLINDDTYGPIIADNDWKREIPLSLSGATFFKNDVACNYTDIDDYDVLYYSEHLNTVWAYDNKVTGVVEAINPNQIAPQSVMVAGKTYTLDTSDVSIKFSTLGTVKAGDTVTLLLGKDSTIVDVLSIDEYNTIVTGVVMETGSRLVEDDYGAYSYVGYVTFVDAAGNEYQQNYDEDVVFLSEEGLVRVIYVDGEASVSDYDVKSISFGNNTFNSDSTALGDVKLASNVKILDFYDNNYISLYPERLAGITLGSSTIYYYELNDKEELSQLILNNITGDMDEYGIFTGTSYQKNSGNVEYEYVINGEEGSIMLDYVGDFDLDIGPKGFEFEENELVGTYDLMEVNVSSLGKTTVQDTSKKYPIATDCGVYFYLEDGYVETTIDKISDLSKYKVTAYYDKAISSGGRVRVIVAESIN